MSDFTVRVLDDGEHRAASDVFRGALHMEPVSDEHWSYLANEYEPGRVFGAFVGDRLVGTTMSLTSDLVLPGGARLPLAAVTGVGVRSDHTRRGLLTELMRTQLTSSAAAGEVFAGLHASEGGIYGRFGYGISTTARTITVQARRAEFRQEVPRGGEVRLVDADEAVERLPAIYEALRADRPGSLARPPGWWSSMTERRMRGSDEHYLVALHTGPDGADGYVAYFPMKDNPNLMAGDVTIRVNDMHGSPAAINDLWRYLLSIDLAGSVSAWSRPLDEPVEAMLVNQHVVRTELDDELWLRILNVPQALVARTYADVEPVIIEIRDRLLPNNSGRYRIGPDGARRVQSAAILELDVDALAMLYLGTTRASTLARVGRIEVYDPAALPRVDRLFATDADSWCGTMF
jgi:predicted acetyltransferase